MVGAVGAVLYGTAVLLPMMLQGLMRYTAFGSGLAVSPRGIGSLIGMAVAAPLVTRLDQRMLIAAGFGILSWSSWLLATLSLDASMQDIWLPCLVNGVSVGLIFVPLAALAVGRLRQEEVGNATALFNLVRNLGGSVGVSVMTTLLARGMQTHQAQLSTHLQPFAVQIQMRMAEAQAALGPLAHGQAFQQAVQGGLYAQLVQQSTLLAFLDAYRLLALLALLCVPLVLTFARVRASALEAALA
jgi:DHA2 family multidrug resistance protein